MFILFCVMGRQKETPQWAQRLLLPDQGEVLNIQNRIDVSNETIGKNQNKVGKQK
uniref:Uncharacterized protein n=1 Tax=Arundo donax TaxID=35708 RepID=A0A0A9E7J4_ARUDO